MGTHHLMRQPYKEAAMVYELTVCYNARNGIDMPFEDKVEEALGGTCVGRGVCLGDGERDMQFEFTTKDARSTAATKALRFKRLTYVETVDWNQSGRIANSTVIRDQRSR